MIPRDALSIDNCRVVDISMNCNYTLLTALFAFRSVIDFIHHLTIDMARSEVEAAPQPDDVDALFEVDRGIGDILDTIRNGRDTEGNNTREPKEVTYGRRGPAEALGIDEEVKITKKRAPVAKLDVAR